MRRASRLPLLMVLLLVPVGCADDGAEPLLAPDGINAKLTDIPGITVMSQNLYLGVNLDVLLTAETPADVLVGFQQLVTSNAFDAANPDFGPRRLRDVAWQIVAESPHLVGLQEVTTYEFEFADASTSTLDFIAVIKGWLDAFFLMGLTPYQWTPIVNPLVETPSLTLPLPSGDLTVTHHDAGAILVRSDVGILGAPVLETFEAVETFSVFGIDFPFWRGYEAVTVSVEGRELVFVNTHLEVQRFEATQLAQAEELIEFMDAQSLPVVAVGDFNSAANHDAPEEQTSGSYHLLRQAGFADVWLRQSHSVGGVTCCQAGDLTNADSELTQRLDLVLARWGPAGFAGQADMEVVGEESTDQISFTALDPFTLSTLPLTLWPSDHAGVVATLWPAPGRGR
jgi:hypothetical protein